MRRALATLAATAALTAGATPALACGGLIGPNGAVNLTRTTTFAGYANGVEHYVTSFAYAGGGGAFGSLTPLPGIPTKVERGGDWTLQRLGIETTPVDESARKSLGAADALAPTAQVILQTRVDALDITVLKGGGAEVGQWAEKNGFRLPPDAPEVLDFYAARSPIFLAAVFDADEARRRGQSIGDGTPVHVEIPTDNPWVPLRILALGKNAAEPVQADVYLLTEKRPTLLSTKPVLPKGFLGETPLRVTYDKEATPSLLDDLRTDRSGDWVPRSAWLTKIQVNGAARTVDGDLAIDATGLQAPSFVKAGLSAPLTPRDEPGTRRDTLAAFALVLGGVALLGGFVVAAARR
jgi:hypothetical protein